MWSVFDLERLAFYCQQCHTMAEGGAIIMPEGIMVRCHGQTEEVDERKVRIPRDTTADEPYVVHVFKKPPKENFHANAPKKPNLRFFCKPDNKIIAEFLYQYDFSGERKPSGEVHVFVVKCTGKKCGNTDHHRLFTRSMLSYDQMYGDGPPLLIDLHKSKPVALRSGQPLADPRGPVPGKSGPRLFLGNTGGQLDNSDFFVQLKAEREAEAKAAADLPAQVGSQPEPTRAVMLPPADKRLITPEDEP